MSSSNSRLAYLPEYELLDQARADEKGIRLRFDTYEAAWSTRCRLHYARNIDRRDNLLTEDPDSKLYGASVYDPLIVKVRSDEEGKWWVYIERMGVNMIIESLSEEPNGRAERNDEQTEGGE